MLKRIMAWILLIGFILLLLNIAVFKIYWQVSVAIYLVIMLVSVFYIVTKKK